MVPVRFCYDHYSPKRPNQTQGDLFYFREPYCRHRKGTLIVRSLYLLLYFSGMNERGELFDQGCPIACTVETRLAPKTHSNVSVYSSK